MFCSPYKTYSGSFTFLITDKVFLFEFSSDLRQDFMFSLNKTVESLSFLNYLYLLCKQKRTQTSFPEGAKFV